MGPAGDARRIVDILRNPDRTPEPDARRKMQGEGPTATS